MGFTSFLYPMPLPAPDLLTATYDRAVAGLTESLLVAPYPGWYAHINRLPLPERLTYCVLVFEAQVGNGGLHQYFWNGYGQFAYETVGYLALLGAAAQAGILRQALALLEAEEPVPDRLRDNLHARALAALNDFAEPLTSALDRLTDAYFAEPAEVETRLQTFLATGGPLRLGSGLGKQ